MVLVTSFGPILFQYFNFIIIGFIAFAAENCELVKQNSSLQSQEKDLQQQLRESSETNRQQHVYIAEMETRVANAEKKLKEMSNDILKTDHELKSFKGTLYWQEGIILAKFDT